MKEKATGKRILSYIRPYFPLFAVCILLSAVDVALSLAIPIKVGNAIDLTVGKGQVDFTGIMPILRDILLMAVCAGAAQWLVSLLNNRAAFGTVKKLRTDAFKKLQRLPLSYLDSHPSGETVSRIVADADRFSDGLLLGFTRLFTGFATIIGTLGFMLRLHKGITLVVVLLTPVSVFAARYIAKHTYSMFSLQSKTRGEQTAFIDEMLTGQKVVKAFGREKPSIEKFDEINGKLQKSSLKAIFYSSLTNPCTRFVNSLVYAGVALCGALLVLSTGGKAVSVGMLTCFLSYANQYTKPFNEISGVFTEFQNAVACAERIFSLLDEKEQTADGEKTLERASGRVCIDNVSFSYDKSKRLLESITVDVQSGQHIAIVGPTGCGKTTLINLLMRFYDADEGTVSVDGSSIKTLTRKSLRENYGMVLQDTWLMCGTVKDNIALGNPGATEDEIIRAAKAAYAHPFITRLPDGYNTVLGENGGGLSEGQKQLICIARIMLRLPPMLILDEATSSIDTRTEQQIQHGFSRLMAGKTAFIVAHRLSTVKNADLILVMKDGNIVEQGNHESLMQRKGFYYELWNAQVQ
ncbi:MAG: ABC transporter ATP-binding protein/permease [Clostridia bacterium]|nr:ABC transporter ATP-binding protein/permease [Clostridia bacterium]